jgi:hypothetical protein
VKVGTGDVGNGIGAGNVGIGAGNRSRAGGDVKDRSRGCEGEEQGM